ncbi:hypothetical protein WOLCODRAFT_135644 [Wolfiporia cocos MD-104 SS10]|uniref:DUF6533 domain-containing protein n=1 Tax=Wolfiporia cocos (strain MD-104) TaxID=742152 RepID=A0A2H3IWK1_WOLCO|nr:hypothetical protein WOLCODRAFT_135644 [Wolfiporia cocos MD-104 SS10]
MSALAQEVASCMQADRNATYLALTSFAVLIYDYSLTFSDEVRYFWTGQWSVPKVLFILNRYVAPIVQMLFVVGLTYNRMRPNVMVLVLLSLSVMTSIVIQAMIVIKIWCLYPKNRVVRAFVFGCFLACNIAMVAETVLVSSILLRGGTGLACGSIPRSAKIWKIFLPNLILHTVLYVVTSWPAFQMFRIGGRAPLLSRLVQDGSMIYGIVFVTALWTTVSGLQTRNISLMISGLYSNVIMVVPSIFVSRLMLRMRSLAASLNLNVNADMLLSAAELSRVRWRPGSRSGEIVVDVYVYEDERVPSPSMTCLGAIEMENMPGIEEEARQYLAELMGARSSTMSDAHASFLIID